MLNDAVGFEKIFIATGYTDLRRGIDGLAMVVDNSHKYLKSRLLFSGIHDCYPPSK